MQIVGTTVIKKFYSGSLYLLTLTPNIPLTILYDVNIKDDDTVEFVPKNDTDWKNDGSTYIEATVKGGMSEAVIMPDSIKWECMGTDVTERSWAVNRGPDGAYLSEDLYAFIPRNEECKLLCNNLSALMRVATRSFDIKCTCTITDGTATFNLSASLTFLLVPTGGTNGYVSCIVVEKSNRSETSTQASLASTGTLILSSGKNREVILRPKLYNSYKEVPYSSKESTEETFQIIWEKLQGQTGTFDDPIMAFSEAYAGTKDLDNSKFKGRHQIEGVKNINKFGYDFNSTNGSFSIDGSSYSQSQSGLRDVSQGEPCLLVHRDNVLGSAIFYALFYVKGELVSRASIALTDNSDNYMMVLSDTYGIAKDSTCTISPYVINRADPSAQHISVSKWEVDAKLVSDYQYYSLDNTILSPGSTQYYAVETEALTGDFFPNFYGDTTQSGVLGYNVVPVTIAGTNTVKYYVCKDKNGNLIKDNIATYSINSTAPGAIRQKEKVGDGPETDSMDCIMNTGTTDPTITFHEACMNWPLVNEYRISSDKYLRYNLGNLADGAVIYVNDVENPTSYTIKESEKAGMTLITLELALLAASRGSQTAQTVLNLATIKPRSFNMRINVAVTATLGAYNTNSLDPDNDLDINENVE